MNDKEEYIQYLRDFRRHLKGALDRVEHLLILATMDAELKKNTFTLDKR